MTRRTKSTSTANAVRVMSAKDVVPPANVPLSDEDMSFFTSVINEFARADWTSHQLELAAMLAKKMRLLRDELQTLENEGFTMAQEGKASYQNPRLGGVRMLDTSIMSTRRSLQLHARAREGEARDTGKRKSTNVGLQDDLDDNLLARPN